jgi:pyridoxine 5-phosphate synthase
MVRLSVNVNKVATLRNSRGGAVPSVLEAVDVCIAAGAPGITVHPRADRRHITPEDTRQIAHKLAGRQPHVELNVEGDPRPDLLALVREVAPDQCTLVPVVPGEITSHAGWQPDSSSAQLRDVVADLKSRGIRVSVFVDPRPDSIEWAAAVGADRVELYTEPYARAFGMGIEPGRRSFQEYVDAARLATSRGLGINAGHDLDLENLVLFRTLPGLDEVSIGHAIISRAVFVGLATVVREYLGVVADSPGRSVESV